MLVTGWVLARLTRFAGTVSPRRPAVYLGASLIALLLWPFTVIVLVLDGMNWLVRLVPQLRRLPSGASWLGALVLLVALYAIAPKAGPAADALTAAAASAHPNATLQLATAPTTPLLTSFPMPTPTPIVSSTPAAAPSETPTATPPPSPTPAPLVVLKPANGTMVTTQAVTVSGTAPGGARIVHDIPFASDTETAAAPDGTWAMQINLSEGRNDLTFRVGDDPSTTLRMALTYVKQAPVAKLGKPVVIDGIEVTILKAQWSTGSQYFSPPKGYVWVAYQIRLRAVDRSRGVSSSDWVALADGTRQGGWTITGDADWEPLISFTDLRAGASTTGWIAFEMPRPNRFIELIYDPSFFSGDAKLTFTTAFP